MLIWSSFFSFSFLERLSFMDEMSGIFDVFLSPLMLITSFFSEDAIAFRKDAKTGEGFGIMVEPIIGQDMDCCFAPVLSGFGYNVGAKVYFREQGPTWRPRASIFYGINGLWAEDTNQIISPDNEKFS